MRPRTLKVLYNILYELFQNKGMFICHTIEDLVINEIITKNEFNKLQIHFIKQYPTKDKYIEFYKHISFNEQCIDDDLKEYSWFRANDKEIRIKFLEAILLKLS